MGDFVLGSVALIIGIYIGLRSAKVDTSSLTNKLCRQFASYMSIVISSVLSL